MTDESLPLFPDFGATVPSNGHRHVTAWRTCPHCTQRFWSNDRRQKFCSRQCWIRSGVQYKERFCVICTAPFHPKKNKQICCSQKCQQRFVRSGPLREVACKQCKRPFITPNRQTLFCSDACRNAEKNAWTPERQAYSRSIQARRNEQQRQRLAKMTRAQRLLPGFNSRYKARITLQDLETMLEQQQGKYLLCDMPLDKWEIDHIVALNRGGLSVRENLQILCRPCNVGKWTMSVEEYIAHCMKVADFAREAGADTPKAPAKKRVSKSSY